MEKDTGRIRIRHWLAVTRIPLFHFRFSLKPNPRAKKLQASVSSPSDPLREWGAG